MLRDEYTGCVYVAINTKSRRRYIGKTCSALSKRIRCHKSAALHGGTTPFNRAIRKYGMAAFRWVVLYVSGDDDALFAAERALIAAARATGAKLYNRTDGGEGAPGGFWSPESRKRLSEATKGRVHSPEAIAKMSAAAKGKKKSAKHCAALSKSRTGLALPKWSDERRAKHRATWERKVADGFTHTEETRQKMSAAAKRRVR